MSGKSELSQSNGLEVQNLVMVRKGLTLPPITFSLLPGAGMGIYGPNGCGKSTLLDTIAGILPYKSGKIEIQGRLGYAMTFEGIQQNLTGLDNLFLEANYAGLAKQVAEDRIIKYAQLCRSEDFLEMKVHQMSAGMRVRLMITASLLTEPDILLLDEAFNALDETSVTSIKEILQLEKEKGLSILFVSHNKQHFDGVCENILELPAMQVHYL